MKDKKIIIIFIVLGIIFTILGGTLAYWNWQSNSSQSTAVTFTVTAGMSCSADGGGNITNQTMLAPSTCDNANYALIRPITVSTTTQTTNEIINLDLYLHVDSIAEELLDSDYFMYAITRNGNTCDGAINTGSFGDSIDSETGNITLLINEEFVGTETKTYYLYIWLDEAETNPNTMNKSFSMSLEGSCSDTGSAINKVYASFGTWYAYFKDDTYNDNITSVSFVNEINVPDNAINWSLGASPSNADDVKAWLEDDGLDNNTFALKIGANGTIFATSLKDAFYHLNYASNFDLSYLNTSETTRMDDMFMYAGSNATNFSLNLGSGFYTSNVTNMASMFYSAGENATNWSLNLGNNFNTSNVTNMHNMFSYMGFKCTDFTLNLGEKFNTSNVTNMVNMFYDAGRNATNFSLNLGNNFNTSKITNMSGMFSYMGSKCTDFTLNLGEKFNTSNVTNMSRVFVELGMYANNFDLNLGNNFNTSKVTNMDSMFDSVGTNATNFNLNLGNHFNTVNVIEMTNMFTNVGSNSNSVTLNLGNHFNTSNVTNMWGMFEDTGTNATNFNLNLGNNFDTSNVTNMGEFFAYAGRNSTNFSINLGNKINTSKVTYMWLAFARFGSKTQTNFTIDLSSGDFYNVTNNTSMFSGFGNNKATIYVKDADAQSFIIAQNPNFNASNVLIK